MLCMYVCIGIFRNVLRQPCCEHVRNIQRLRSYDGARSDVYVYSWTCTCTSSEVELPNTSHGQSHHMIMFNLHHADNWQADLMIKPHIVYVHVHTTHITT